MKRPRRILLITRNLPPLVGGMERLNWHMAEQLAVGAEVRIVGPQGSAALAPTGITVCEAPLRPLWKFLWVAARLARREARQWRPDVVLAGSGLTAPLAQWAARTCGARTAAYVHGLDIAVRHPVYRALWRPAIRHMHRVIANSRATADLCRDIGVESARIGIVHPGVDLPATGSGSMAQTALTDGSTVSPAARFCQCHDLGQRPLLLSVGRLSTRKGLREFVTQALPRIVAAVPDVLLVSIGDAPKNALHAQAQTPATIQAAAEAVGVGEHLRFLGKVTDDELASAYRVASVHVFPVRELPGDPEGFGMVAVEAAAHGLPTVAFATGGIVDAVAEGQSGYLVASGDYAGFAEAVIRTMAEREALRGSCAAFAQGFIWPEFGARVAEQLNVAVG